MPQTIRSSTYWRDFHRARAAARRRADPNYVNYNDLGPLQSQSPIYTFTPSLTKPLITIVQNDGSLVTHIADGAHTIAPGHPAAQRAAIPRLPSTVAVNTHRRRCSEIARRAQARLDARPHPDDILLARLASRPALAGATKSTAQPSVAALHPSFPAEFPTVKDLRKERKKESSDEGGTVA
ncbi:hypothetical protein B0H15DRAFT_957609 [Mycena belliarum]|uniref:Uncharacterized protein n=1 Tax=Mycena belliarum TaxID=1033014 RepID=A0AAD6XI93_9AGAR|nr:hypothetical protein B0H15DRAFT_957609 [Mycena belliae]